MLTPGSSEYNSELIHATQCAASARAVAAVVQDYVTVNADITRTSVIADLVGAIDLCLQATAESHARLLD